MVFAFEKLKVCQKAIAFADSVCTLSKDFPRGYFFLADQLNRASLSIAAMLAFAKLGWIRTYAEAVLLGTALQKPHGNGIRKWGSHRGWGSFRRWRFGLLTYCPNGLSAKSQTSLVKLPTKLSL